MGDPDRADAVLHAARDRELALAWKSGSYLDVARLGALKLLIGYGIGAGYFGFSPGLRRSPSLAPLSYRIHPMRVPRAVYGWLLRVSDHLLPIVELNKEFADFFDGTVPARLKRWQLNYFAFHALFGFLLGSFVLAAFAGLTQTG